MGFTTKWEFNAGYGNMGKLWQKNKSSRKSLSYMSKRIIDFYCETAGEKNNVSTQWIENRFYGRHGK